MIFFITYNKYCAIWTPHLGVEKHWEQENITKKCPNHRPYHMLKKESKGAKIRNRYNQVPHLTQDTKSCTVNLEIFARVLFSRNFSDAKFRDNKTSQTTKITLSFTDVGKSCPSREF